MTSSKDMNFAPPLLRVSTLIVLGLFQPCPSLRQPAPAQVVISQIVPSSGPVKGGNVVRLLGRGFTANTSVWIWANQAGASRLVSANELDVVVPRSTTLVQSTS